MPRVSGTTEARKAWIFLRGPYLATYIFLLLLAFSLSPTSDYGDAWKMIATAVSGALILGSVASWLVVSKVHPPALWRRLATLEVTGLRLLAVAEIAYSVISFVGTDDPLWVIAFHFMLGFFALGVMNNLTWHKGVSDGDGSPRSGR